MVSRAFSSSALLTLALALTSATVQAIRSYNCWLLLADMVGSTQVLGRLDTEQAAGLTRQLLARHGVVSREVTALEPVAGGFSTVYPVLRRLEDTGRVRRGYFVAGLGGAQFAEPGAVDRLRAERDPAPDARAVTLAATDPGIPMVMLYAFAELS